MRNVVVLVFIHYGFVGGCTTSPTAFACLGGLGNAVTVPAMSTINLASVRHILFRIVTIAGCIIGALLAAYIIDVNLMGIAESLPELQLRGNYTPSTNELVPIVNSSSVFLLLVCVVIACLYAVKRRPVAVVASFLVGIGLYVAVYAFAVINVDPSTKLQYLQDTLRQGTVALIATSITIAFATTVLPLTQVKKAAVFRVNMSVLVPTLLFTLVLIAASAASHEMFPDELAFDSSKYVAIVIVVAAVTLLATLGSALLSHKWTFTVFTVILFTGMTALSMLSVSQLPYGYAHTLVTIVGLVDLIGMLLTLVPAIQADRYATN